MGEIIHLYSLGRFAASAGANRVGRFRRVNRSRESNCGRHLLRHRLRGGAQTIATGLTDVQSSGRPVILRWQFVSGDPTYLAINNIHFVQGPAKLAPVLTWTRPDAIVAGTALSSALERDGGRAGHFPLHAHRRNRLARWHPYAGGRFHARRHRYIRGRTHHETLLVKPDNVPPLASIHR